MTNKQTFQNALTQAYTDLFATNPEYQYSARNITPEALALKMTNGLYTGTANKTGEGVNRACKACGIRQSYKAIQTYFNKGEVL